MDASALEAILREHPLFQGLPDRHLQILVQCAEEVRFDPGTLLFRQGEDAERFYLLRHGKVAVEVPTAASGALSIQTLEDGDVLGWSWLIPPYRWHFDARAVDNTSAISLDGAALRDECERDHDMGYALLRRFAHIMEERLQATRLQLIDVYGSPAREFRRALPRS
jgi:CRP/FNR family transcriptional regulator, cyclic AMP receptor protein